VCIAGFFFFLSQLGGAKKSQPTRIVSDVVDRDLDVEKYYSAMTVEFDSGCTYFEDLEKAAKAETD